MFSFSDMLNPDFSWPIWRNVFPSHAIRHFLKKRSCFSCSFCATEMIVSSFSSCEKKGPLGPSVWPTSENRSSSSVWFQSPTAWSIPTQKRARSSKRLGYVRSAIEIHAEVPIAIPTLSLVGSRPNQPEPDSLSPVPSLKPFPFVPLPGVIKHGLQENTPFGHLVPWIFIFLCPMNFQGCSHRFPYIPIYSYDFPMNISIFQGMSQCPSDALSFVLQIQVSFGLLQLQLCLRVGATETMADLR